MVFGKIIKNCFVLLSVLSGLSCNTTIGNLRGVSTCSPSIMASAEFIIPSIQERQEWATHNGAFDYDTFKSTRQSQWFPRRDGNRNSNGNANKECNVLSMSGGGSYGAIEVGILKDLVNKGTIQETPHIITGISAGGLNAGYLSFFRDNITEFREGVERLSKLWNDMKTDDVYERDLLRFFSQWSIYNTQPLRRTLREYLTELSRDTSAVSSNSATPTYIGATNLNSGHLDIFQFEQLSLDDKLESLIATSAVPFLFPPVEWQETLYVDGGVIADELIWDVLDEGECSEYNVVVILANEMSFTTDNDISTPETPKTVYQYLHRVFNFVLHSFNSQLTDISRKLQHYKNVNMVICYPVWSSAHDLNKKDYSPWNFDNGNVLRKFGENYYRCDHP